MISCSCSANPISKSLQGVVGRESQERASTLKSWEPSISLLYNPCHVQLLSFCVFVLCASRAGNELSLAYARQVFATAYSPALTITLFSVPRCKPKITSAGAPELGLLKHTSKSPWTGPSSCGIPSLCFPGLGDNLDSCSGVYLWPHLSASSKTTYSTLCSFKFISTATCINRPGVAMILEGKYQPGHPRLKAQHSPQSLPRHSGKGPQSIPPNNKLTCQGSHAEPQTGLPF